MRLSKRLTKGLELFILILVVILPAYLVTYWVSRLLLLAWLGVLDSSWLPYLTLYLHKIEPPGRIYTTYLKASRVGPVPAP